MLRTVTAFAALLVASTLVIPTVSQAAEPNSMRVSYADLNLATDLGKGTLERRIVRAAKVVCVFDDDRHLDLAIETNVCRSGAIDGARPAFEAAVNNARRGSVTVLDAAALIVTAP